uniref:Cytochrome c oxidase subunit 2 n=1 Tax=Psococerastis albimaculata TaxID=1264641 RepID=M9P400_9NEOP|nr:cytochrome c oxidase subunit II [Psococerastis albimaculata]AFY16886.1 cytochrome c oxidase subunit II [Psococerastis albimaculata]
MATWSNLNLQESSSPLMEQLNFFHDHSILILLIITCSISYLMVAMISNKITNRFLMENQLVEMIWTVIPGVILIFIALPSLRILYLLDEVTAPSLTLKTIGHQWYWSYEYSDFMNVEFDSYMVPPSENNQSDFRLLEVNNRIVLPYNTQTRILVTAADVLHSWAMPSLGVKVDANPGRINQTSFLINYPGLFYGQCSEICGSVHSFMPIVLESTTKNSFINWLLKNSE